MDTKGESKKERRRKIARYVKQIIHPIASEPAAVLTSVRTNLRRS
jgi:hypothetical protein